MLHHKTGVNQVAEGGYIYLENDVWWGRMYRRWSTHPEYVTIDAVTNHDLQWENLLFTVLTDVIKTYVSLGDTVKFCITIFKNIFMTHMIMVKMYQ